MMMKPGPVVLLVVLCGVISGINAQPARPPLPPMTPSPPMVYPGRYMILAGNTIRPGMPLTLSVSIFETKAAAPVTLDAAIIRDTTVEVSSITTLQTGTHQVTLQVPITASAAGDYSLRVIGTGGLAFNETKSLIFSIDHFSIFVQSDKAIYKPGQTVRYRVMAVYPDLKPYVGPYSITVSDANGNVIEQMMNKAPNKNGIISEEMVMSDHPVLGDWVIKAEAEGQSKEYTIKIDEYVLPKFEVTLTVPPWIDASMQSVPVSVTAKYTFGKPVEGTLSLGVRYAWGDREIQKALQITNNGVVETQFSTDELVGLKRTSYDNNPSWREGDMLRFTANMTETLTGITQQADEGLVSYHSYPVKVVFQETVSRSNYKPGLPYHVYLVVSHQDGTPLTEEERVRGLTLRDCRNSCYAADTTWSIQTLTIAAQTGVVEAFIQPSTADRSINLLAEYKGIINTRVTLPPYYRQNAQVIVPAGTYIASQMKYLNPATSDSNSFIQVSPDSNQALTIGSQASFSVQSTSPPGKLTYQIVARGNILESETITGVTGTEYTITKPIIAEMSPKSKLIVYYLTDGGEVVLDSLEFVVNVVFDNPVTASFSKVEAEPGASVNFDVDTTPGAFVGILAIDKSVLLLADGNDITHNQVLESVGRFDTTPDSSWGYSPFRDIAWCFFPYPTSGDNAGRILKNAGIIYITDGNVVYVEEELFLFRQDFFSVAPPAGGFAGAGMAPNAGGTRRENEVVPEKKIRKEFPETWLWVDTAADSAGRVSIQTNFPDTITSWVGTAISMDAETGLGVTQNAAQATVIKNFFISLNLPYSVIRGEKFVLEANIFNYLDKDVTATVQLQESSDYYILRNDLQLSTSVSKSVTVSADGTGTANFAIEPIKNGMIELVVTATAGTEQDGVRRQLLVEPEGVAQEYVVSDLVDFSNMTAYSKTFSIDLPSQDVVPDSTRAVLTATGDILGPTMNNLDQLLRMPSGCGEQTMIGFAPDVFIYKYLTETGQGNPAIEQKALNYMKKGYQRELTYQHEDGSFSAWGGDSGDDGSTWLTAFVVRSFLQAAPFIYIDPAKMELALQFLNNHQSSRDGSFQKSGRIVDQGIEGGVSSVETLTAYCAIAMDQARRSDILSTRTKASAEIALTNAMNFLVSRYTNIQEDKYAMSIVTYALTLGGSTGVAMFRDRLNELATLEDEGRLKYWTDQDQQTSPASEEFYYWVSRGPPSAAIEMTGYGMLAYMAAENVIGSVPVAAWLSQQRNSLGGYSSTQDTVIALLALTTYAERVSGGQKDINLSITATADATYSQALTVNNQNSIILQQFELPVDSGNVTVEGSGVGSFLLSFILHYNLLEVNSVDVFDVTITVLGSDTNSLELRACGRYTGSGEGTGMAIMDIGIPSGFYVEEDPLLQAIAAHEFATKHEISGKSVVIYLNEIPSLMDTCITVQARRANTVAATKPSVVKVYSYYTPEEQTVKSYSASSLTNTDICTMCPDCCSDDSGAVPSVTTPTFLLISLTLVSILGALLM